MVEVELSGKAEAFAGLVQPVHSHVRERAVQIRVHHDGVHRLRTSGVLPVGCHVHTDANREVLFGTACRTLADSRTGVGWAATTLVSAAVSRAGSSAVR